MSVLLYPFLVIINLIGTVLTYLLAPLVALFWSTQDGWLDNATKKGPGPRLHKCLSWFQTPDNSLDGDHGFEENFPEKNWWSKVHWLWQIGRAHV